MHMLSKKDLRSGELETLKRSRSPISVVTADGEVQTNEVQVYLHDLHTFVTVQLLEDTPAVFSFGKLCKEHDYTYEWPSDREPRLTKNGNQTLNRTENFVPLVGPGLSSSSTTASSSTSPPQDLSVSLDTASNEGPTGNCSEGVAGNCMWGPGSIPNNWADVCGFNHSPSHEELLACDQLIKVAIMRHGSIWISSTGATLGKRKVNTFDTFPSKNVLRHVIMGNRKDVSVKS